jgi:hypothetical protein
MDGVHVGGGEFKGQQEETAACLAISEAMQGTVCACCSSSWTTGRWPCDAAAWMGRTPSPAHAQRGGG